MLGCMAGPVWCQKAPGSEEATVAVSVFNEAGIPAGTVQQAENIASHVFRQAGLQVIWVNCGLPDEPPQLVRFCTETAFPTHLHLRILGHARNLPETTFGVSYLGHDGSGCYSDVFAERVEALQGKFHMGLAPVLGHVAAHEIAHLLLGTNSHSSRGIMQARWQAGELMDAAKGALIFSAPQGQVMRERLSKGAIRNAKTLTLTANAHGY